MVMALSLFIMLFAERVLLEALLRRMPDVKFWMFVFWIVTLFTLSKWNPLSLLEP